MYSHILTSEDGWFIEKGLKDSISRTPFEVGQTVVVCDKRHVMLADFYDGECPTCHSRNTVPFSRENIEQGVLRSYIGECPKCFKEVNILFTQHAANKSFVGKCPSCSTDLSVSTQFFVKKAFAERLKKYVGRIKIALELMLGLLVICLIALMATDTISNDKLIAYLKSTILPRSQEFYKNFLEFVSFDKFYYAFKVAARDLLEGTTDLFRNIIASGSVFLDRIKWLAIAFWEQMQTVLEKTNELIKLLVRQTRLFIKMNSGWVQ